MATTFQNVIDRAQLLLADSDASRYPEADLLTYAQRGEREACTMLPPEAIPSLWATAAQNLSPSISTFSLPNDLGQISFLRMYTTADRSAWKPVYMMPQEDEHLLDDNDNFAPSTSFIVALMQLGHLKMKPAATCTVTNGFEIGYQRIPSAGVASDNLTVNDIVGDALVHYVVAEALASDRDAEGWARERKIFETMIATIARRNVIPITARRAV